MHPWSFRDHLVFGIGFALTRSRSLLRRILSEHAPDDARRDLANRVVTHLERSGFELDEDSQALRKRAPLEPHGSQRGEEQAFLWRNTMPGSGRSSGRPFAFCGPFPQRNAGRG